MGSIMTAMVEISGKSTNWWTNAANVYYFWGR
jgi:hypothetical protein